MEVPSRRLTLVFASCRRFQNHSYIIQHNTTQVSSLDTILLIISHFISKDNPSASKIRLEDAIILLEEKKRIEETAKQRKTKQRTFGTQKMASGLNQGLSRKTSVLGLRVGETNCHYCGFVYNSDSCSAIVLSFFKEKIKKGQELNSLYPNS
ncbi:hypothetical protein F8388_014973 [Cannabis sativa]|uniref:Uncharacterized protein n=1 Tax=Cannabis sativa TaxID=3483 RepID=A0A7J6DWH6_CANSA|nr:hypothetical protein F8388_014973 [Cannabis sativa]